ncbi:hypothetical protein TNCT_440701 [Trichonephila clavata]|uniref:Uncharacterized protein n=1 Tax=Trichonephila clavata TaxID=2740835 RepID=A0A8X6HJB4_TRICU|nr:hypothetical protein TNCT_440701 [Trichonephila clavata]
MRFSLPLAAFPIKLKSVLFEDIPSLCHKPQNLYEAPFPIFTRCPLSIDCRLPPTLFGGFHHWKKLGAVNGKIAGMLVLS